MTLRWGRGSPGGGRIRGRRRGLIGYGNQRTVVGVVGLRDVTVGVDDDQQRLAACDGDACADIDAAAGFEGKSGDCGATDKPAGVAGEDCYHKIAMCGPGALVDDGHEELAAGDRGRGAD